MLNIMVCKEKIMYQQRNLNLTAHILLENNIWNQCFLLWPICASLQLLKSLSVDYIHFSPPSCSLCLSLHFFRSLPLSSFAVTLSLHDNLLAQGPWEKFRLFLSWFNFSTAHDI